MAPTWVHLGSTWVSLRPSWAHVASPMDPEPLKCSPCTTGLPPWAPLSLLLVYYAASHNYNGFSESLVLTLDYTQGPTLQLSIGCGITS